MKKIVNISTDKIIANPLNPRKTFEESSLNELAESITKVGVLQPITVRLKEDSYEIVCGERRWRATKIAGIDVIPAIVRDLTDEEAMDVAITENLQRQDVSPLEETDAFHYLIDKGWSVQDMAQRFGKSEAFVRGRLKLIDLVDEFRSLLAREEISLSQAMELSKIDLELQTEVFREHFADDVYVYQKWTLKKPKELSDAIQNCYSTKINDFAFDLSECANCKHNSAVFNLFGCEMEDARCFNQECKKEKAIAHEIAMAKSLSDLYPTAEIVTLDDANSIVLSLQEDGFQIEKTERIWQYKEIPTQPTEEQTKEEVCKFNEQIEKINNGIANGELKYVIVVNNTVSLQYYNVDKGSGVKTAVDVVKNEINELKTRDTKNIQLKDENTCKDVRELLRQNECPTDKKLSKFEEQLLYYLLASNHDAQIFGQSDTYSYVSDEEKFAFCANLNAMQKALIIRKWINSNLSSYGQCNQKLWADFVEKYYPDEVATIRQKYQSVYDKRKTRLEEKISELEFSIEVYMED